MNLLGDGKAIDFRGNRAAKQCILALGFIPSGLSRIIEVSNGVGMAYGGSRTGREAEFNEKSNLVCNGHFGVVAAYLMYRRGESFVSIARKTVTNPVSSLVSGVKNAV
jgi:hypothetical protein